MRVLVACEESQTVCKAFRLRGHEAYSADIQEPSGGHPEWHILGDVLPLINGDCTFTTMDGVEHTIDGKWDLLIAHPPCTDIAVSGARWFAGKIADGRQQRAINFFMMFANAKCNHVAIENPICIMSRVWRKPDQIIQPWMFGHGETKATCLWLNGLPLLNPTNIVGGREQRIWKMSPGKDRAKLRSKTFQGIARDPADGPAGHDRVVGCTYEPKQMNSVVGDNPINTLVSTMYKDPVAVCVPINTQIATRHISLGERTGMGWGEDGDPAYTLQAGHEHAVLCAAFTAGQGAKANGIGCAEEQAHTLRADGGLSAMPTVLCRAHGQSDAETLEECCPTLNCNHEQPIVFESHSMDARYTQQGDTSPACTAQWGTGGNNMPLVAEKYAPDIAHALRAKSSCSFREDAETLVAEKRLRLIVRRLTPTECERLQGFPDGWTDIGEVEDDSAWNPYWEDSKGKRRKIADSPRYKALGNSIALPQWWWLTCKMAAYLPEHATLGSLFDGIGGFPLVWETRHGKGTAVWASEIEEFPIAVTKERFK